MDFDLGQRRDAFENLHRFAFDRSIRPIPVSILKFMATLPILRSLQRLTASSNVETVGMNARSTIVGSFVRQRGPRIITGEMRFVRGALALLRDSPRRKSRLFDERFGASHQSVAVSVGFDDRQHLGYPTPLMHEAAL